MILIGLGSNVTGPWGTPTETVQRALHELDVAPLRLKAASKLLTTKPFGVLNQPDFINAVAVIETTLSPEDLLRKLHMIEASAGRLRNERWGPRTLDLDLLDYQGLVNEDKANTLKPLQLPHPGIAERVFVLQPLAEVAPQWRHPISHKSAEQMLKELR